MSTAIMTLVRIVVLLTPRLDGDDDLLSPRLRAVLNENPALGGR